MGVIRLKQVCFENVPARTDFLPWYDGVFAFRFAPIHLVSQRLNPDTLFASDTLLSPNI